MRENYKPYISDPVKGLVRKSSGSDVISDNKAEYLALWIRIGLKYPRTYIAAWVEQTKGYWNAGYGYWFCATDVQDNELGVKRSVVSIKLSDFTKKIINKFTENSFFVFL